MVEQKRAPKLRFKGFSDAWEQRKLGDIAKFSKGSGYSKSDLQKSGHPIILYGRMYTQYETVISNVDTYVKLRDKSVLSEGNEVIVPSSGESAEEISRASAVKQQGIILGGDLNIIKPLANLNSSFLALILSSGSHQKELSKRAQGKSVVHLHNSDLKQIILKLSSVQEQIIISNFFQTLDHLITLHQRKLDLLKQLKKAYLQVMFPAKDEKIPKVRFANFEGEWELHSLGNFCQYTSSPITIKDIKDDGLHDLYDANTCIGKTNKAYMQEDYITIIKDGAGVGRIRVLPKGTAFLSTMGALTPKNSNLFFLLNLLKKADLGKGCIGSTIPHIYFKDYSKNKYFIPSQDEQGQIGLLFQKVDTLIKKQQKKIEKLNSLKKAYLKNMFI
ncbi:MULTISPECIES: restriction endonuclease subunit S [unclassified Granulicatella]|uniref:restriction endonuclease subunit S n=1 Tax=unclassified Granulicatella TaxID=2630493 RepID=UPI0014305D22|nr:MULTISPECIES: restriction endonuclease subunit S [unclassified Granulicatella]MBF0780370.1 restriction endonuclease subunit S [Granulicatella sp. 19428wC4_WM01]